MFRRFLFSRIWSSAQDHAVLALFLNLVGFFISTWPRWSDGNVLYHSCTTFEGASREGQPLNIWIWFIGAGGCVICFYCWKLTCAFISYFVSIDAREVFHTDLPVLHGQQNFAKDPRDYVSAPIYTSTAPVGIKTWRTASPVNRHILTIAPSEIGFLPMNEPYTKQLIYDQELFVRSLMTTFTWMRHSYACLAVARPCYLMHFWRCLDDVIMCYHVIQICQKSTRQSVSHITSFKCRSESLNDF